MPGVKVEFKNLRLKKRLVRWAFLLLVVLSLWAIDFDVVRLVRGFPAMGDLLARIARPSFDDAQNALSALAETFEMAIIGTALGLILSIPMVLLTAQSIAPSRILRKVLNFLFAFFRTIPSLVWAALLVSLFSIGRFAGLIALTIIALLIAQKLLREAVESLPQDYLWAVTSVGAGKTQVLVKAVLPKLFGELWSTFFLILESNVRSASVLGFVGAGGIGQILWRDLNHLRYDRVAAIITLLFVSILLLDLLSLFFRTLLPKLRPTYKSLKQYKIAKTVTKLAQVILIPVLLYVFLSALDLSWERLALGREQGWHLLTRLFHPDFSYWPSLLRGITETFFIAISATLIGAMLSLVLSYLAAFTISPNKVVSLIFKALINLFRSFPPMITAIIFFRGVGPGPMAGTLALSLYTAGVLSKLYNEVLENLPENIRQNLFSTGATRTQTYVKGLLPQSFDRFLALCLYRLESNIRNSTLLGIVGAGGIGQLMNMNIQVRAWERVGLLLFALALLIFLIDRISAVLQHALR